MKVYLKTWNHIGDTVALTGAVRNVKNADPSLEFVYCGWGRGIWQGNGDAVVDDLPAGRSAYHISYGTLYEEQRGMHGNWVEGFTRNLCRQLSLPCVPMVTNRGILHCTREDEEAMARYRGYVLLNANCQYGTQTKWYPHWQEVVDALLGKGLKIVQVGSNQKRNITHEIRGVEDLRGGTESLGQYFALVKNCAMVLTPPSGIIHIAGAFVKGGVVVNGAREAKILTSYDGVYHASGKSCGWDGENGGCVAFSMYPCEERPCRRPTLMDGDWCAGCMADVPAEEVIALAEKAMG